MRFVSFSFSRSPRAFVSPLHHKQLDKPMTFFFRMRRIHNFSPFFFLLAVFFVRNAKIHLKKFPRARCTNTTVLRVAKTSSCGAQLRLYAVRVHAILLRRFYEKRSQSRKNTAPECKKQQRRGLRCGDLKCH